MQMKALCILALLFVIHYQCLNSFMHLQFKITFILIKYYRFLISAIYWVLATTLNKLSAYLYQPDI